MFVYFRRREISKERVLLSDLKYLTHVQMEENVLEVR